MNERIQELLAQGRTANKDLLPDGLDLPAYTAKILNVATVLTYNSSGSVAAFIAYYDNDPEQQNAFLTMLLVDPAFKGKGLGQLLLDMSIRDLSGKGFAKYSLEVAKSNPGALALYKKSGFEIVEDRQHHWLMRKSLK